MVYNRQCKTRVFIGVAEFVIRADRRTDDVIEWCDRRR